MHGSRTLSFKTLVLIPSDAGVLDLLTELPLLLVLLVEFDFAEPCELVELTLVPFDE